MKPEDDPKIRFLAARILAKEYLRRANAQIGALDRVRFRANRYLAIANEAMREAESAAIEVAVVNGEEREIEREVWRGKIES